MDLTENTAVMTGEALTKSIVGDIHLATLASPDDVLDEEVEMAQHDEGWGQDGPQLILNDQTVTLKLPHLV